MYIPFTFPFPAHRHWYAVTLPARFPPPCSKGSLVMQFKRGDLAGLPSFAPKVARAMAAAGVAFAGDGALSGGGGVGLEMSQRSHRKCST